MTKVINVSVFSSPCYQSINVLAKCTFDQKTEEIHLSRRPKDTHMATFSFLSLWAGEEATALWVTRGSPCVELAECRWQEERPEFSGNLGTSQAVEA